MNLMSFQEFSADMLEEELALPVAHSTIDITDETTMININSALSRVLSQTFLTPYIALDKIKQVLSSFSVNLDHVTEMFDEGEGSFAFAVTQFGDIIDNDLDEITFDENKVRFVYFAWSLNDDGYFNAFASLVDSEELEALYEDEYEDEDSEEEDESVFDETDINKDI